MAWFALLAGCSRVEDKRRDSSVNEGRRGSEARDPVYVPLPPTEPGIESSRHSACSSREAAWQAPVYDEGSSPFPELEGA